MLIHLFRELTWREKAEKAFDKVSNDGDLPYINIILNSINGDSSE